MSLLLARLRSAAARALLLVPTLVAVALLVVVLSALAALAVDLPARVVLQPVAFASFLGRTLAVPVRSSVGLSGLALLSAVLALPLPAPESPVRFVVLVLFGVAPVRSVFGPRIVVWHGSRDESAQPENGPNRSGPFSWETRTWLAPRSRKTTLRAFTGTDNRAHASVGPSNPVL